MTNSSNTEKFASLNLIPELLEALEQEGYHTATPIQSQAIPHILAGKDLLGCAQTGTGKTAAFALPLLQNLTQKAPLKAGSLRALILTPTRELAAQIAESFERYGARLGQGVTVIFGGVGQGAQVTALRRKPSILVATPGRLLDLIEQGHVNLKDLEFFVLDEADRMLDMGFIHDVRRVLRFIPAQRQTLFFSATMPPDIQRLAQDILSQPVKVEVTPEATTAEKIKQSIFFVEKEYKRALLGHLMNDANISRALVFTRTKHGADRVAQFLNRGGVRAEAIHGNKSQNNRIRALDSFKAGETRILVATDIAARGIDIDEVTHVINFDLPNVPESYVHRIGRTARAGAEGVSYSFCDQEERAYLRDIERIIRMKIPVVEDHPWAGLASTRGEESSERPQRSSSRRTGQGSSDRRPAPRSRPPSSERNSSAAPRYPRSDRSASASSDARRPARRDGAEGSSASRPARSAQGDSRSSARPARDSRHRGSGGRSRSSESSRPARTAESSAASSPAPKTSWWKKLTRAK